MDYLKALEEILLNTKFIALATSYEDQPDVRLMDCIYLPSMAERVFIVTDETSYKVQQFEQNEKVAFTSVSADHKIVRCWDGKIRRSDIQVADIYEEVRDKMFWLDQVPEEKKKDFVLYEIVMGQALVQYGAGNTGKVIFD